MEEMVLGAALRRQAQNEGTLIGGAMGLVAALSDNIDVRERLNNRKTATLQEQVDSLQRELKSPQLARLKVAQVRDFVLGLATATVCLRDGQYVPASRPAPLAEADVSNFTYPPHSSVIDSAGNVAAIGQNWRLALSLSLPEVQAAVGGLQLPQPPTAGQLKQILTSWSALQTALSQTAQVPTQSLSNISVLAGQIAAQPLSYAQIQNTFQGLLSQASQSVMIALAGAGPLSQAQTTAIASYFSALISSIINAGGAAAVSTWIASQSPALADPALDVAWPVTGYNSSSLEASAVYTSAALGALVLGAQATAIVFKYGYNQEQQTARSFRVKVTPTTTAGTLFSAYLPAALRNLGAPKVHLQVEGIGVVAGGSPYVSAVAGGATPYFTVATGTNPAASTAYNLVCMVTN